VSWDLELLPSARKSLRTIPQDIRERIAARVEGLMGEPRPPDSRGLVGNMRGLRRIALVSTAWSIRLMRPTD
jgi:hypothetical protein